MEPINQLVDKAGVVTIIQGAFLSAATTVLFTSLIPSLSTRFLDYGPRSSPVSLSSAEQEKRAMRKKDPERTSLLDKVARWQVPHSWFVSFYIVSVSLSIVWLVILFTFRSQMRFHLPRLDADRASTPFSRQLLTNVLLLAQGIRRLLESYAFQSSSKSTMWIGHWIMGICFYFGTSVAVWIEGLPAILDHDFSLLDLEVQPPSLRSFICLLLFTFASGVQHDCHAYLASLKRSPAQSKVRSDPGSNETQKHYQIPRHPVFNRTLTPHYLAECVIYMALTILAAPDGRWLNLTLLCTTVFVCTNLGITAVGTKRWYIRTFGAQAVQGRWAIVPYVL